MYPLKHNVSRNYSQTQENPSLAQLIMQAIDDNYISKAVKLAETYINRSDNIPKLKNAYSMLKNLGRGMANINFIQAIENLERYDNRLSNQLNYFISNPDTHLDGVSYTQANFIPHFHRASYNFDSNSYPLNADNQYAASANPFDNNFTDYSELDYEVNLTFNSNFNNVPIEYALNDASTILTPHGKSIIRKIIPFVGKLIDVNGTTLGGCILIDNGIVLVPKHCLPNDGRQIYIQFSGIRKSFQFNILRTGQYQDYIVIEVKKNIMPSNTIYPKLRSLSDNDIISNTILLHYPNNSNSLLVSGNTTCNDHLSIDKTISTYHATSPGSSGGIHIDNCGNIIAIHTGVSKRSLLSQRERVGLSMRSIEDDDSYFVEFYNELDLEGHESQKMLYEKSKHVLPPKYTRKDRGVTIATAEGVKWIKQHHNSIFQSVYKNCLGKGGLHKNTQDYSLSRHIESDHILPANVIKKSTKNEGLEQYTDPESEFYIGGGSRPGEKGMPAVTIPYDKHRNLLTTGSGWQDRTIKNSKGKLVTEQVNKTRYHDTLINLCNNDNVYTALRYQIQDYYENDLCTKKYAKGIIDNIKQHLEVGAISNTEAQTLITLVNNPAPCANKKIEFKNNEYKLVRR